MRAVSPQGVPIVGTLERVTARADIVEDSFGPPNENGNLEFEYDGYSEVFWDSQTTVEVAGFRVFLDEEGNEWDETQILLQEDEPDD